MNFYQTSLEKIPFPDIENPAFYIFFRCGSGGEDRFARAGTGVLKGTVL
jgi:hypothetical protein